MTTFVLSSVAAFMRNIALGWFSAIGFLEPARFPQVSPSYFLIARLCDLRSSSECWKCDPSSHWLWWFKLCCWIHIRVAHASTWMQLYCAAIWIEVQRLTQKMPRDSMVSDMPSDGWSSWRKVGRYARSWPASRSDLKTRIRPGSSEGHVS